MTHERYEPGSLVEEWLREPTFVPAADLERVSAAIARTPQRRERPFRLPHVRFQTMINATKAAAAVAIIGISGSLLTSQFIAGPPDAGQAPAAAEASSSPASTPGDLATESQPVAPSTDVPVELSSSEPSGMLDTLAGPAPWVRLVAGQSTVPGPGMVLPWAEGIAVWDRSGGPRSLRATIDGLEWREVQLPAELDPRAETELYHFEGMTVLHSLDDESMWIASDGGWRQLDTTALREASPNGWAANVIRTSGFQLDDDRPTITLQQNYRLPYKELGLPRIKRLRPLGEMRYALCSETGSCNEATARRVLHFKEVADGLVVRNDRTGTRIGLIEGAKSADLYQGRVGSSAWKFALDGDTLVSLGGAGLKLPEQLPAAPMIPGPLPAGTEYWHAGSTPLSAVREPIPESDFFAATGWWAHIGGGWVDLAELEIPGLLPHRTNITAETVGDTTLIWFQHQEGHDLWVVQAPSGA